MEEKKKILFVDDEVHVLQGLMRMLRPQRREWAMTFVENGIEALELFENEKYDVVVCDMHMPKLDGAELLGKVMERSPHTVRIILSGSPERDLSVRSIGVAHQYLSKPCDAETLKAAVARACALRAHVASEPITKLVSCMTTIPSVPSIYLELLEELRSPEASVSRVGRIVGKDVGMLAKVLQLVNSAFFGVRRQISDPIRAVSMLGLENLWALALSTQVFSQFSAGSSSGLRMEALWNHCMTVGMLAAQAIAKLEVTDRKAYGEYFAAGLLHDTGMLVLSSNFPGEYGEILEGSGESSVLIQKERDAFGATHSEIGAYLLGIWGLPDPIVEAIAFHHCPRSCVDRRFGPLVAVHVADALAHELAGNDVFSLKGAVDTEFLQELGVAERLTPWRTACETALAEKVRAHE